MGSTAQALAIDGEGCRNVSARLPGMIDLVTRAREGDRAAYEQLYRQHVGRVYALCLRLSADPVRADEYTQDAFVRAWRKLSDFRGDSAFSTWLHRVAVNVVFQARRSEKRGARPGADESRADRGADGQVREEARGAPRRKPGVRRALAGRPIEAKVMMNKAVGILFMSLLLAAPNALGQQRLNERRPAATDGTIKITNALGSVRVVGWDRDKVAITGMLDASAEGLDFTTSDRETRIRVRLLKSAHALEGSQLVINVPRRSHVAVRTSAPDIEIRDVDGALDLESVSGHLRVSGHPRMVYAESAGGNVIVDAATKVIRAKSVNGDVTVSRALGYLEVSTVSGNARVQGGRVWEGEITSVSGDFYYGGDFDSGGSFYIESHSGAVELLLPAAVAADFDITTLRGGSLQNDFAPAHQRSFSTGGSGARVRARSFKGNVKLRRQS